VIKTRSWSGQNKGKPIATKEDTTIKLKHLIKAQSITSFGEEIKNERKKTESAKATDKQKKQSKKIKYEKELQSGRLHWYN
jgi:hypothetical protein